MERASAGRPGLAQRASRSFEQLLQVGIANGRARGDMVDCVAGCGQVASPGGEVARVDVRRRGVEARAAALLERGRGVLRAARLDAGAGTQLDVLNAQVQLATAETTKLQALFGYNSSLAEFDRATGAQSTYTESFNGIAPHATRSKIYDTGSGVDATGKRKKKFAP